MVTKKKNDELKVVEAENKKRAIRKSPAKKAVGIDVSSTVASNPEFASDLENNNTKNNVVSQTNPGRFTAEMLIVMGKRLEEEENSGDCETVARGEEIEKFVFVQSFEKPQIKDAIYDETAEDVAGQLLGN